MKYYVIYEKWFPDEDSTDGIWEMYYRKCEDLGDAERFIEIHKKALNIRNIIGPLSLARSFEKNG